MTSNDEALAQLREQHPGWEVWRVDRYLGDSVWCARPSGKDRPVLNAYQPAELSQYMADCEAGHRPTSAAAVPHEEAVRRLRAVAAELAAHGITAHLHDSRHSLDLTARFCVPGERETELLLDEDGYAEVHYWITADAEPDEITALALRVLAAATGTAVSSQPGSPAPDAEASPYQGML